MYIVADSATGTSGLTGDGQATSALMSFAIDVSADDQGNLYISDWAGNHLREVTATTAATITAAPGTTSALYPAPGGITITQPGGAQVTFYSQTGGQCTTPYVTAGQYCAPPLNTDAALALSSGTGIAQPGGPDAGDSTVNTYDSFGRVTQQTDPMGFVATFDYSGMNQATGDGIVRVSDPDGNATV